MEMPGQSTVHALKWVSPLCADLGVNATEAQKLGRTERHACQTTGKGLDENLDFTRCSMRKPREPISRGRLCSDVYVNKSVPAAGWSLFWEWGETRPTPQRFQNQQDWDSPEGRGKGGIRDGGHTPAWGPSSKIETSEKVRGKNCVCHTQDHKSY